MNANTKIIAVAISSVALSACSNFYPTNYTSAFQSTNKNAAIQLYPDGYDNGGAYAPSPVPKTTSALSPINPVVGSSETYHVSSNMQPQQSFKIRDNSWVKSQNPQGYTIELATDEKAAPVASVLQQAPKNERMAEVKYQQGGKNYYKGVYGTYPSYQAAQQALNNLPENLKQNAGIKTWGSIQSQSSAVN